MQRNLDDFVGLTLQQTRLDLKDDTIDYLDGDLVVIAIRSRLTPALVTQQFDKLVQPLIFEKDFNPPTAENPFSQRALELAVSRVEHYSSIKNRVKWPVLDALIERGFLKYRTFPELPDDKLHAINPVHHLPRTQTSTLFKKLSLAHIPGTLKLFKKLSLAHLARTLQIVSQPLPRTQTSTTK